ncbi:MAG: esterase-like activity of phytase family protein [Dongiaceae bacterium]
MMRHIALFMLGSLSIGPAVADQIDLTATPVAPDNASPPFTIGRLEYLAGFALTSDAESFGGLSGASLSADGGTLTALADTGTWFRLALRHDATGRLTGVAGGESGRLKDEHGKPLTSKYVGDAESITRAGDGSYYVTFEGWNRLWRYRAASDPLRAAAKYVRAPKGMTALSGNEGVEAAAQLPDRRFLLLSEGGFADNGDLQGWLGDGKRWAALTLTPTGAFRPTDLTVLPGGDLLLLERSVSLFGGFAARLSVIPAASIAPGARLSGEELGIVRSPLPVDNFEAAAARAAPDGSVLIYILSDDNFSDAERTLLLQFRWRL